MTESECILYELWINFIWQSGLFVLICTSLVGDVAITEKVSGESWVSFQFYFKTKISLKIKY